MTARRVPDQVGDPTMSRVDRSPATTGDLAAFRVFDHELRQATAYLGVMVGAVTLSDIAGAGRVTALVVTLGIPPGESGERYSVAWLVLQAGGWHVVRCESWRSAGGAFAVVAAAVAG